MALGIGMIQMYTQMVREEWSPVIQELGERQTAIYGEIEKIVKQEKGYYEVKAKRAAIQAQLEDVNIELFHLTGEWLGKSHGGPGASRAIIDKEVKRRLKKINVPLETAQNMRDESIKGIKLASAGADVQTLFANIRNDVRSAVGTIAALPPLKEVMKSLPGSKRVKK